MANSETGISRFAVDTSTRERADTPVLPGPIVKPVFKPPQPEKPKKEKNLPHPLSKRQIALRATGITLGVLTPTAPPAVIHHVNYETELNPPAIIRDIKSIPGFYWDLGRSAVDSINKMFARLKPAETVAPTLAPKENLFPNTIDKSSFTPITQEQAIEKLKDNNIVDLETHTIRMFLPIGKETLDEIPNLRFNQKAEFVLPPYVDKAKLEGVKNVTQIDVANFDGKTIISPIGGKLYVISIAGQRYGTEPNIFVPSYSSIRIDFKDKDGRSAGITIGVLGGKPLFDLSKTSVALSDPDWKNKGIEIAPGQPLFKVSETSMPGAKAQSYQAGQITIIGAYDQQNPRAPIPLTIDFLKEIIVK